MTDAWEDMKKTKEEEFFLRQNREAMDRHRARKGQPAPRLCVNDGQKLERLESGGIVMERCPTCQGVWLDAKEFERIRNSAKEAQGSPIDWLTSLFGDPSKK